MQLAEGRGRDEQSTNPWPLAKYVAFYNKFIYLLYGFVSGVCGLLLLQGSAEAGSMYGEKELAIGLRSIEFMVSPPRGRTLVGVVYDPSLGEAVDALRLVHDWPALNTRQYTLIPVAIPIDEIGRYDTLRVVIVATSAASGKERILNYARQNKTLIVGLDAECARQGTCVVGVSATPPPVQITINQKLSIECNSEFNDSMRIMAKEY